MNLQEIRKRYITHWVTTSNQEMLAHLKILFRHLVQRSKNDFWRGALVYVMLFFHCITSAPILLLRIWVAFSFQFCSVSKPGISDTWLSPNTSTFLGMASLTSWPYNAQMSQLDLVFLKHLCSWQGWSRKFFLTFNFSQLIHTRKRTEAILWN